MDEERNSNNNGTGEKNNTADEIMLPGFRFHPTDEELVGFYLRRKTLQRPLSIELIKQLDIYKYDPWDLPKLATMSGEKEWYFYCPRDRKYRNSARPNRVTEAGFWKATGTDRPIYSSCEGSSTKCNKIIGLKKSLVFYKGRAAKGTKTDWMMHEFRLPSSFNHSSSAGNCKRFISNKDNQNIPAANDAWAICRIFKKVNSTAQRATSHFWGSPAAPPVLYQPHDDVQIPTHPHDNMSHQLTSTTNSSLIHFGDTNHNKVMLQSSKSSNDNPTLDDVLTYKYSTNQITTQEKLSTVFTDFQTNNVINQALEPLLINEASNSTMLSSNTNMPYFGDFGSVPQQHVANYACPLPQDLRRNLLMMSSQEQQTNLENHEYWSVSNDEHSLGSFAHVNFPLNLVWDSMPCPSDVSSTFSTNKHYI